MSNLSPMNARLLQALNERSVEYLVVGGWAVKHYWTERKPCDLDLWINPSDENRTIFRDTLTDHLLQSFGISHKDKTAKIISPNRTQPLHICLKPTQQCDVFEPQRGFNFSSMFSASVLGTAGVVPTHIVSSCDLIAIKRFAIGELRSNPPKNDGEIESFEKRLRKEENDINRLMERRKTEASKDWMA